MILDVFDDVEGADQVECAVGKGQGGNLRLRHVASLAGEGSQGWRADVDELGLRKGQSGPQSGSHLEALAGGRDQGLNQGPGVEPVWLNQACVTPQRIVVPAIDVEEVRSGCRAGGRSGGGGGCFSHE